MASAGRNGKMAVYSLAGEGRAVLDLVSSRDPARG
jgi:hypothetical protein